jgi:hypothetical protein
MIEPRCRSTTRRALPLCLLAALGAHAQIPCEPDTHDCPATEAPPVKPDPADKFPLIADGKLQMDLRSVIDVQSIDQAWRRHSWVLDAQLNYTSGFTSGPIGFGADVSPFLATRLNGSANAGNLAHVQPDGQGSDDRAWAYLGKYDVKARVGDTVVKYGLQRVSNPVLESKDNRGLPPTFRGTTLTSAITPSFNVEAGDFNAVMGRGHSTLKGLTTEYAGTSFGRISYAGANWDYSETGSLSVYLDRASDVWNQAYASLTQSVGDPARLQWTGAANFYVTQDQGARRQGPIDSRAWSLSLTATHGPLSLLAAYQRVDSDQFFDDVNDAWGITLANALAAADYNAPHEQSLQFRATVDAASLGAPGLKLIAWTTASWGADASAAAGLHASPDDPQNGLYWVGDKTARGGHHETGIFPSYTVQDGRWKGAKVSFLGIIYKVSALYPDHGMHDYKLQVDVPIKIF